jgi:hypothetical protein
LARVTKSCTAAAPFMEFLTRALGLPWSSGDKAADRELSGIDSFQLG